MKTGKHREGFFGVARAALTALFVGGLLAGGAAAAQPMAVSSPDAGRAHVDGPLLAEALAGPLAGVEEIVFGITGKFNKGWEPFNKYYRQPAKFRGAYLYKLNLRTSKVTCLLEDPEGELRDVQVHYDGKRRSSPTPRVAMSASTFTRSTSTARV
jgi:hypothetical protein